MSPRLIGGEMLVWSDLDGQHGPGPVRGPVFAPLLAAVRGRVLVLGPHHPELIDAVPAAELTVLVRSVPDAEALAARFANRPGLTVYCGSLEKLPPESGFDTIVALDGMERLSSVEGSDLSWSDAIEMVLAALRPDGQLILAMENLLGLHRLVALRAELTDSDWVVASEYDLTRPAGLPRVAARLRRASLDVTRTYLAYPGRYAPSALFDQRLLDDEQVSGFVMAAVGAACAPTGPVLADPARLATNALRHGAAAELAPAWVLFARRTPATPAVPAVPATPAPSADAGTTGRTMDAGTVDQATEAIPAALIAEDGSLVLVRGVAGRWLCQRGEVSAPVPTGHTLADLLIAACLHRDLPKIRELLLAWQADATAAVAPEHVVVGPHGGFTALAPAATPALALRAFAASLIGGGYPHPWPNPADDADLALTLATLAGRDLDPTELAEAAPADAYRPDRQAFRELSAARDQLAEELAESRDKQRWYEQMLTAREDALKRAQRLVTLLSATGTGRLGKVLIDGARATRRTARTAVRRIRSRSS